MAENTGEARLSSPNLLVNQAAATIREHFGFGFVGVSLVPDEPSPLLEWGFADGSTSKNYEMIRLPPGVGALGKVYDLGKGLVVDSVQDDIPEEELFQYPIVIAEALASFFAFPLVVEGSIKVILICGSRFMRSFDDASVGAIQRFSADEFHLTPCGEAPVRVHGEQEGFAYSELSQRILTAQEDERRRIARELHDGISQEVLVAQMELRRLSYVPTEEWLQAIAKVSTMLRNVMSHLGSVAYALRPSVLDELGLASAMQALCFTSSDAFGINIVTDISEIGPLGKDCEIAAYRIFQEALANACKYSEASKIEVGLSQEAGAFTLCVTDDGVGFDPSHVQNRGTGLGLGGMKERASLIGGLLSVESAPGQGTTVTLQVKAGERL